MRIDSPISLASLDFLDCDLVLACSFPPLSVVRTPVLGVLVQVEDFAIAFVVLFRPQL